MALRRNAKVELLRNVPLFAHCSKNELAAIAAEADELDVSAGRPLTVEGQSGREFVVLVERQRGSAPERPAHHHSRRR